MRSKLRGKKYWQVKAQEKADIKGWLFVQSAEGCVEDDDKLKVLESAVAATRPSEKAVRL